MIETIIITLLVLAFFGMIGDIFEREMEERKNNRKH